MNKEELSKQCITDVKQLYKRFLFSSKKERVNHPTKPYTRSGKSPFPFDKFIGRYAKKVCGNEEFFKVYKKFNQLQNFLKYLIS